WRWRTEHCRSLSGRIVLRIPEDKVALRLVVDGKRPFEVALVQGDHVARGSADRTPFAGTFYPDFRIETEFPPIEILRLKCRSSARAIKVGNKQARIEAETH